MAPELFQRGTKHNEQSDIFSLGVTLWEITARKIPFVEAANPQVATAWVTQGQREEIPQDTPPPLAKMITWCWDQEKDKRPTAAQVVQELQKHTHSLDQVDSDPSTTSYRANLNSIPALDSFRGNLHSK